MSAPLEAKAVPQPDLMRAVAAATDAMTDSMVMRTSSTMANLLEVADALNDDDTRDAIITILERLTEFHRIGGVDTLFSMLEAIHCGRMAMTDSMVSRLLGFIEHMANNLGNEEMATMISEAYGALEDAIDETKKAPEKSGGILATVALLAKPETQQTLRFMLTVADKMKGRFGES